MPITLRLSKTHGDKTGIRTILLQAFSDRLRQILRLFKRVTSRPLDI